MADDLELELSFEGEDDDLDLYGEEKRTEGQGNKATVEPRGRESRKKERTENGKGREGKGSIDYGDHDTDGDKRGARSKASRYDGMGVDEKKRRDVEDDHGHGEIKETKAPGDHADVSDVKDEDDITKQTMYSSEEDEERYRSSMREEYLAKEVSGNADKQEGREKPGYDSRRKPSGGQQGNAVYGRGPDGRGHRQHDHHQKGDRQRQGPQKPHMVPRAPLFPGSGGLMGRPPFGGPGYGYAPGIGVSPGAPMPTMSSYLGPHPGMMDPMTMQQQMMMMQSFMGGHRAGMAGPNVPRPHAGPPQGLRDNQIPYVRQPSPKHPAKKPAFDRNVGSTRVPSSESHKKDLSSKFKDGKPKPPPPPPPKSLTKPEPDSKPPKLMPTASPPPRPANSGATEAKATNFPDQKKRIEQEEEKKKKLAAIRAMREEQAAKNKELAEQRKRKIEELQLAKKEAEEARKRRALELAAEEKSAKSKAAEEREIAAKLLAEKELQLEKLRRELEEAKKAKKNKMGETAEETKQESATEGKE